MTMKEFRDRFGFSQSQAAEVLGYNGSRAIRAIELGEKELSGPARKAMEYYCALQELSENSP